MTTAIIVASIPAPFSRGPAMPWYQLVKGIHFMGLVPLAGVFVIYLRVGPRLRAATTRHDVRSWLGLLELMRPTFHAGAAMMLFSGLIMAGIQWRAPHAFIAVGMVTLLAMWIAFAFTASRHLHAMRTAVGAGDAPIAPALAETIGTPLPWIAMFAINFAAVALIFLMTLKLGWAGSIALVLILTTLGIVAGSSVTRGERTKANPPLR
jgi:hypothetical protein